VLQASTATGTNTGDVGLVWAKPILRVREWPCSEPAAKFAAKNSRVAPFKQERDHVVVGPRPVMGQKDRLPCGVITTSSTQWLWIADTLGFDPEWCFLGTDVGDADWTAFLWEQRWVRPVAVVFCDGRPPPFAYQIDGVVLLFHCKAPRRYNQATWKTHSVRFWHSDLGGLTLRRQGLLCTTAAGRAYVPAELAFGLPSCVYSVASDTLEFGRQATAPASWRMGRSKVSALSASLFHGGGLYPVGEDAPRSPPVFLLPSVHQPTGWCKRQLTTEEE
jgi:hypothetical protein